jgi:ribosome-binding protein aMBF1 (putative translation factor)
MGKKTKSAVQIVDRMIGDDSDLREMVDEELLHAAIARMILEARTKAGLTQVELARRVGTRQPAIARIEDADYRGHSLGLLSRIARALGLALAVRLQPATARSRRARKHRAVH